MPATRIYTDTERIAVAQAYIDALVTHNGDAVGFAPECTRVEVGLKTGFSGNHLRRSLNRGLQYRIIASITTPAYTVVGDEVRARYDLVTKPSLSGRRVGAHLDEVFVIPPDDGKIHHIRASIRPFITR
jgi:hypothetical protein